MNVTLEIILIGSIIAISCSIVGVFLVLRKMSMMSDAITHTVLLGIVIAFFMTHDLNSPWLFVGAVITGLFTVYLIEYLVNTRLMSKESAIGIVFPFLFSIAIILISVYAGNVHLDTDAVLLGELAFAPFDRITMFGLSIPTALVSGLVVLLIDALVLKLLFKELSISTFDYILAATLGFSPILLNYLLMSLVSITSVGAFNAVGSILVISFMIGPPTTAYLLTNNLKKMFVYSIIISIINVVSGYYLARFLDVSIAGSMALTTGLSFILVFLFSRKNGYISKKLRTLQQKKDFAGILLLFNIQEHELDSISDLEKHINWRKDKLENTLHRLQKEGYLDNFTITPSGQNHLDAFEAIIT